MPTQNFQSDCHIPLKADVDAIPLINETFAAVRQFLRPKLNSIRQYLTEMRLNEFDMDPESMQMIQDDFLEMRRGFNASAADLHLMLIVSRMLGILNGKSVLDAESWQRAKTMEYERRTRVEITNKNNTKKL